MGMLYPANGAILAPSAMCLCVKGVFFIKIGAVYFEHGKCKRNDYDGEKKVGVGPWSMVDGPWKIQAVGEALALG